MNINSPITELIIEPFQEKIFKNYKVNNIIFGELSLLLSLLSIYYYNYGATERASLLYLISYILFYKYSKVDDDIFASVRDMIYFSINIIILLEIFYLTNLNTSTVIIITLILCLTLISFCIRKSYNNKNTNLLSNSLETNNIYIKNWNNFIYNVSNTIYPNNSEDTRKYHTDKFWKIFDYSFFSLLIYLFLNL